MPKKRESIPDAELALLTLLAEYPMHGYQIEEIIHQRGMREWTQIGFSSIYYLLEKMKSRGWLSSTLEKAEGKGPARQVFRLTTRGRRAWQSAALDALSHPRTPSSNFQLGLANIQKLEEAAVLDALRKYFKMLAQKQEELSVKMRGDDIQAAWHALQMFDLSLNQITCEMNWLDKFIHQLENRSPDSELNTENDA